MVQDTKKISQEQVILLTFASGAGTIVYTFTWITHITGRPFWVAVFIGVLVNIPFAIWILYLGKFIKGGTIFDILQMGIGKFLCNIIIVAYIFLNTAIAACMLNMFTGTIKVFFLQTTPSWVIMLFIVFICCVFANSEIKILGQFIGLLVVLYMFNFISGFSLSFIKDFNIQYVIPIFDTSFPNFLKGILITAGISSECLLFLMAAVGSIPNPQKHYMWAVNGLAFWAVLLSLAILVMEGVESLELLSRVAQTGVTVASLIQIGKFIRGVEILVLGTYQLITIAKISLYLYSSWISVRKLFNNKLPRLQLPLLALAVFFLSAWINSYNTGYFLSIFIGAYIFLPFALLVLLLATLGVFIQNKKTGSAPK